MNSLPGRGVRTRPRTLRVGHGGHPVIAQNLAPNFADVNIAAVLNGREVMASLKRSGTGLGCGNSPRRIDMDYIVNTHPLPDMIGEVRENMRRLGVTLASLGLVG